MKITIDTILRQGRLLFAISIASFGVQNLVCASTRDAFLPVIPWVPGPMLAYLTGVALLAGGLCIAVKYQTRLVAILLGLLFLLCVLLLQITRVFNQPLDVGVRTCAFETLSMSAIAFILAGTLPAAYSASRLWDRTVNGFIVSARHLFAVSMLVFGIDHYVVFKFIISLIPAWIPGGGWFWAQITSMAFIAASLSIATNWMARTAAAMLGLMFGLWFVLLHAPRVLSYPRYLDPDEWSSAFIALAICGGSWILARSLAPGTAQISLVSAQQKENAAPSL